MSKEVVVEILPDCNFCGKIAHYDSVTVFGSWGYTCEQCQNNYGAKALGLTLGTGIGQKLVLVATSK